MMAISTAPRLVARPGPSLTALRGRKRDIRSDLADMRDELTAAGQEMVAAGRRIEYAIVAGRGDVALHVAARLQVLGATYLNPDPEGSAA